MSELPEHGRARDRGCRGRGKHCLNKEIDRLVSRRCNCNCSICCNRECPYLHTHFFRLRTELAITGKAGRGAGVGHRDLQRMARLTWELPNEDTVSRIVGAVYSHVRQGTISQVRKTTLFGKAGCGPLGLEVQLRIPLPHADRARLRQGGKNPERVF